MILIIDNNTNSRGQNIAGILTAAGIANTYYKFVTGSIEKTGDWDELKNTFETLIGENTVLIIHKNNSYLKPHEDDRTHSIPMPTKVQ